MAASKSEEMVNALADVACGGRAGVAHEILLQNRESLNDGIGRLGMPLDHWNGAGSSIAATAGSQESFTSVKGSEAVVNGIQRRKHKAGGEQKIGTVLSSAGEMVVGAGLAPTLTGDLGNITDSIDNKDLIEDTSMNITLGGSVVPASSGFQSAGQDTTADDKKVDNEYGGAGELVGNEVHICKKPKKT